jgi:hypothetical protein
MFVCVGVRCVCGRATDVLVRVDREHTWCAPTTGLVHERTTSTHIALQCLMRFIQEAYIWGAQSHDTHKTLHYMKHASMLREEDGTYGNGTRHTHANLLKRIREHYEKYAMANSIETHTTYGNHTRTMR